MRNKDINKELLIREKAIDLIVREGFDGLSMQKLAKAVGISASTIYIYFKNREELLNELFTGIETTFEADALKGFDPDMPFEEGLWLQWQNRYKNIVRNPTGFLFFEQFRNSPLIARRDKKENAFRKMMNRFMNNAMQRKEVATLSPEIFWALAYGAFYTLIKFHLDQSTMAGKPFSLNEHKMRQAFEQVIKSLIA